MNVLEASYQNVGHEINSEFKYYQLQRETQLKTLIWKLLQRQSNQENTLSYSDMHILRVIHNDVKAESKS